MGKHPYSLFLLFSVFIFVCLFYFVFHETGLLALRLFPIPANQGISRRQTLGLWPIKNGRPRGIKDFLTTLGVTTGWWLHPTIRKRLTGGVTLHSISTKGSEWVSEWDRNWMFNVQGFSCWMGFSDTIKSSISKELLCESIELCTVFTLYLQCLLCYGDHKLYLVKLFVAR